MVRRIVATALASALLVVLVPEVATGSSANGPVSVPDSDGQSIEIVLSGDTYNGPQMQSPFAGGGDGQDNAVITADIQVDYAGFTAEAEAAFQAAVDIWERFIYSPKPIHVNASWAVLSPGVLGSASTGGGTGYGSGLWIDTGKVWPQALYEMTCNCELGTGTTPGSADYYEINAKFSSAFSDWYLGTDGNPGVSQIDFVSVVLHELGHGLGFSSSGFSYSGASGSWGFGFGYTTNFGLALYSASSGGNQIMNVSNYANPSTALGDVLKSDAVYWEGTNVAALGTGRARMYAPTAFVTGSSIHHLDDATYDGTINALMTHAISYHEANHNPGPITLAIMRDIGWDSEGCAAAPFADVAIAHPFCLEIKWMKDNGISTGFGSGCGAFAPPCYLPANNVTRQAMSAFMARLALGAAGASALPACSVAPFSDVPTDHPFCKEIKWMADNAISTGFLTGCGAFAPPCYLPSNNVTRQAMSAFLARVALGAPGAAALPACSVAPFSDVPTGHLFCKEIKWMAEKGISTGFATGCGALTAPCYLPANDVTRQAMSAFMFRANSEL